MKFIYLYLLLWIMATSSVSAQTLEWVKQISGTYNNVGSEVITDDLGNVYITGSFTGTTDLDPGPAVLTAVSAGISDIFLCKLSPAGTLIWANTFGGTNGDQPQDLTIDDSGNIYLTGQFASVVDFDPGPGNVFLYAAGIASADIFVAKFNSSGALIFARSIGGISLDVSYSICTDNAGNIYFSGAYQDTADMDPGPATLIFTTPGSYTSFVEKLDPLGNLIWVKHVDGYTINYAHEVAVTGNSVFLTGYFSGTLDFDPGPSTYNMTSIAANTYLLRLDTSGNFIWAKQGVTTLWSNYGYGCVADANGNVYLTGAFRENITFGNLSLNHTGAGDIFIVKADSSGNFIWAKAVGGVFDELPFNITLSPMGTLFISGRFQVTVDFDPGPLTHNLTAVDAEDGILLNLDTSGNFIAAYQIAGINSQTVMSSVQDINGSIYLAGSFSDTTDFDPGPGSSILTVQNSQDAFCMKLNGSVGLYELNPNLQRAYPNPSDRYFYVEQEFSEEFVIMDLSGRIIERGNMMQGMNKLDLATYNGGVYILRCGSQLIKLIKMEAGY